MNKKAIAILGAIFVLIVGTLGFLIYAKYAGKKPSAPAPVSGNATSTNQSNTASNASSTPPAPINTSNIVQLTNDQVVSPALFFNGTGISYFDHEGNLFSATLQDNNGQLQLTGKKQLEIPPKAGITKILWPSKGNDFIAQLTDGAGNTTWSYFNSNTSAYIDLPPQVESLNWMPTADKIIYIWLDSGKASLSVANPDATNYQTLAAMWENDDQLSISPDGSQVLYYETATSSVNIPINSVTSDGKLWKTLVQNGQNSGVLWSPDSQKFLFGKKDINTGAYQLWLDNLTTGEIKNLGLLTTVDKAVWDKGSNLIYAAVPNSPPAGQSSLTVDSFYRLDTTTLDKKQYQSGSVSTDGQDLFLNSTGDKLFFRNAQDGGLYYLDLTQQ